jgi:hypothetical protein
MSEIKAEESAPTEDIVKDFDLVAFLDQLVPPDTITITTIAGDKIAIPGVISARKQIKVFRLFKSIVSNDDLGMPDFMQGGVTVNSVISLVLDIVTNDGLIEEVGKIFSTAYPDVLDGDPLDLLPIEEVVAAIVPLSLRFLQKAGRGLMTAMKTVE